MADVKDSYQGQGGQAGNIRWYRDNGDGTYAEEVSSELRAWDTNALAWVKLKVDNTGALSVTTAAGPGGSGVVTQGARDSTFQPWAVSISGTVSTAPSAGTQNVSLQNSSLPVTQGTSPWIVQGGSMSIAGTVLTSISGTTTVAGTVTANQGTSPWIIAGGNVSIAGTVITSISGTTTVAGTVTANQGTSPWIVSGGAVSLAGTSLVSISGTSTITGTVTANQGTSPWLIAGGAVSLAGTGLVSLSGTNLVSVSGTVTVNPPAITKGTQGTTGFTVQDLKDAGRAQVMLSWEEMAGTAAAESTLTNFTLGSKGVTSLAASTSYTVTSGKTLRIQAVNIYTKATSTVNNLCRFRIRSAASSIANTSPVIWDAVLLGIEAPGTIAAGLGAKESYPIPDGLEVASGTQVTFTWFTAANTCTVGMTIVGYEY